MLILRIGVAFAFLYPPISALYDPYSWLGYFPAFMHGYVPDMVLLHGFGILEVVIALWILSGRRVQYPSVLAALILLAIVIFDFSNFEVVFRDLSIAAGALALAFFESDDTGQKEGFRTS
ncbi:MAG: hypothetical protein JWM46_373 [Candidatus Kaiserbacteria bacterium]|nr:hypothetical protein [Candidatus Kaiserbacteria bacterium]